MASMLSWWVGVPRGKEWQEALRKFNERVALLSSQAASYSRPKTRKEIEQAHGKETH